MKGLLEFQKGIYQSYASSYYGNSTKRLKKEEKEDLEIKVDVSSGSSNFNINFQGFCRICHAMLILYGF